MTTFNEAKSLARQARGHNSAAIITLTVNLGNLKDYVHSKGKDWIQTHDSCTAFHPAWNGATGAIAIPFREWCIKDLKKLSIHKIDVYHHTVPNVNFYNIQVERHDVSEIAKS